MALHDTISFAFSLRFIFSYCYIDRWPEQKSFISFHVKSTRWNKIVNAVVSPFLSFNIFFPEPVTTFAAAHQLDYYVQISAMNQLMCNHLVICIPLQQRRMEKNGYWKVGMILNAYLWLHRFAISSFNRCQTTLFITMLTRYKM